MQIKLPRKGTSTKAQKLGHCKVEERKVGFLSWDNLPYIQTPDPFIPNPLCNTRLSTMIRTHTIIHRTHSTEWRHLVTPAVLPSSPPPLFPFRAIELLLPKLSVDIIMCLAHPVPKLVPTFCPHFILDHELLEVFGADPTRIEL
jgi:hypothetical protein